MPIKGCLRRTASQRAPPRQCVADDEKLETAKGYNEPSILDWDLLNIDSRQEAKQIFSFHLTPSFFTFHVRPGFHLILRIRVIRDIKKLLKRVVKNALSDYKFIYTVVWNLKLWKWLSGLQICILENFVLQLGDSLMAAEVPRQPDTTFPLHYETAEIRALEAKAHVSLLYETGNKSLDPVLSTSRPLRQRLYPAAKRSSAGPESNRAPL
ncbi:uncharacterized protein ASPGLDRAFT_60571 [Aspergillus glaucus CBS 516.65]|uniref:Uncharacterized protein n=1 Tax=Aspergillus glaucus CBS 516.65 TaxID=1160497 RepID=A0A1L9VAG5_ASPGL|nr:hypothetical protein ASPGLDRAFT_60571 [Aspergillus glaucus CBS 516.65]OJJ80865.1 hypothetical protein ASPGLDRAFT_60571 [Aspergillus glaucus CBS 516.65]